MGPKFFRSFVHWVIGSFAHTLIRSLVHSCIFKIGKTLFTNGTPLCSSRTKRISLKHMYVHVLPLLSHSFGGPINRRAIRLCALVHQTPSSYRRTWSDDANFYQSVLLALIQPCWSWVDDFARITRRLKEEWNRMEKLQRNSENWCTRSIMWIHKRVFIYSSICLLNQCRNRFQKMGGLLMSYDFSRLGFQTNTYLIMSEESLQRAYCDKTKC